MPLIKNQAILEPDLILTFRAPAAPRLARALCCPGFAAQHMPISGETGFDYAVSGAHHYVALHDIVLTDGEARMDGLPVSRDRDLRNAISFVPRGCTIAGWSVPVGRPNTFTALYLDPERLRDDLGIRFSMQDLRPLLYTRDMRLQSSLIKLQAVLAAKEPDSLYAETICMTAALELLQCDAQLPAGLLSRQQANLVLAQIEASLATPLTIADLAKTAGLSRYHFARAFKNTVGEAPYRFITLQRIERAMALLRTSSAPVEQVARAVGFNSASQFGRIFRAETGETPQAYRRSQG